jgi:glutaredoxin
MNVQIIATHTCSHRKNLERELQCLGIPYDVIYIEDDPDVMPRYQIRHSPNLVVDGRIVCRGQPTESQLREIFDGLT